MNFYSFGVSDFFDTLTMNPNVKKKDFFFFWGGVGRGGGGPAGQVDSFSQRI